MIFGKYINRYYLKNAPVLLLGLLALLMVDYIQLLIPQFYRLVINGVNLGQVVVNGQTLPFTKEVLLQHICLPMIWIVVLMVIGRFLWRICFFGSAVRVAANLRERMFDHSRRLCVSGQCLEAFVVVKQIIQVYFQNWSCQNMHGCLIILYKFNESPYMQFIDTHIHLQDFKSNCATDIVGAARKAGVAGMVCVSSYPEDWERAAALALSFPGYVVPAFGLHPGIWKKPKPAGKLC